MTAPEPFPSHHLIQADLLRVRDWLQRHEEVYAGIRMDHGPDRHGPWRVVVALAGHTPEFEAELRARAEHPGSLDVLPVRWSLRDLREVMEKVEAKRDAVRRRGCAIPVLGPSFEDNRVRIRLHPYDEGVAAWLIRKFGEDRVLVVGEGLVTHGPAPADPAQP